MESDLEIGSLSKEKTRAGILWNLTIRGTPYCFKCKTLEWAQIHYCHVQKRLFCKKCELKDPNFKACFFMLKMKGFNDVTAHIHYNVILKKVKAGEAMTPSNNQIEEQDDDE